MKFAENNVHAMSTMAYSHIHYCWLIGSYLCWSVYWWLAVAMTTVPWCHHFFEKHLQWKQCVYIVSQVTTHLVQCLTAKSVHAVTFAARRTMWNARWRNNHSGRNRQLTVHLKKNCLPKSNDRVMYPSGFVMRNGAPSRIWMKAQRLSNRKVPRKPWRCSSNTNRPGENRSTFILMETAKLGCQKERGIYLSQKLTEVSHYLNMVQPVTHLSERKRRTAA